MKDVYMLVCDGLKGLPDAVTAVWEKALMQTCIVQYADLLVMPTRLAELLVAAASPAERSA